MLTKPTDIDLMLLAREGDMAAFHELVRRYRTPLRRFFAAQRVDGSQAEDYAQETFLRLWLARERYVPTGKFSTYLFQIARHYWLNQRKKQRPELDLESLDEAMPAGRVTVMQPEAVLLQRHRQAHIQRAIQALPQHYRSVFTLSHFDDLSYAEIACRLGIPVGTVKSRMSEAVRRLRLALAPDAD
jgi:RNA polymerase sigma-70 factor (ECF subfamily)